jgi:RimJ/RimL family protein N-acetyltransferase
MKGKKIFETERLLLRELKMSDAPFIFELVNTEGWLKNIGDRNVKTINDAESFLSSGPLKSYHENNFGMWLVIEKASKASIGLCGLINRPSLDDIDIGYALLPSYYKKGYAYESAQAVYNYGKEQLGINKIVGICNVDNAASIHILQKIGLQIEKKMPFNDLNEVYLLS